MLINDKVDAVFIPDSPSRIKATDYNQIKNEIQECITEAGLTPTKDVIQLPQALKILTAQSGAEEVAKIEAAGQEQLDAINTAGAQAVQDAQDAANTATAKATEAASSASAAASSASAASGSASTAATQAGNAEASAELAQKWATQTTEEVVSGQGYGAKYYAEQAADSAASIVGDAEAAADSATEASASASQAAQSAQAAASSASLADIQNKITNCLTKIPQDINLVLSEGTLTLKAGSKVYVPNGPGVFDSVTLANDVSASVIGGASSSTKCVLLYSPSDNKLKAYNVNSMYSGTSLVGTTVTFYDTTSNVVQRYDGGSLTISGLSFPIALITGDSTQITSIDQVFNGFGFIGSTMFVLPGVEGLYPNGRNADGTLNNIAFTVSNLKTYTYTTTSAGKRSMYLRSNDFSDVANDRIYYDASVNKNVYSTDGTAASYAMVGSLERGTTGLITSFSPQTAFHAVDYSGADFVVNSYSDEEGNWYRVYKSGWVEQGGDSGTYTNKQTKTITLLKAFENTNYIVIPINTNTTADNYFTYQPNSLSATNFQIRCQDAAGSAGGSVKWIAYGQGAK